MKAVTVIEPDKDVETSGVGLKDLNKQLKSLGQYLKSTTFMAKMKFSKSSRINPKTQALWQQDLSGIIHQYSVISAMVGDITRDNAPTEKK